jgi:hypothetical protein
VEGRVLAANSRQKLAVGETPPSADPTSSRHQALKRALIAAKGTLSFAEMLQDPKRNPAAAEGAYMSINLHCALLDPVGQRFLLAVTTDDPPAAKKPFRAFIIRAERVEPLVLDK